MVGPDLVVYTLHSTRLCACVSYNMLKLGMTNNLFPILSAYCLDLCALHFSILHLKNFNPTLNAFAMLHHYSLSLFTSVFSNIHLQLMCGHNPCLEDFIWTDIVDDEVQIRLQQVAHTVHQSVFVLASSVNEQVVKA